MRENHWCNYTMIFRRIHFGTIARNYGKILHLWYLVKMLGEPVWLWWNEYCVVEIYFFPHYYRRANIVSVPIISGMKKKGWFWWYKTCRFMYTCIIRKSTMHTLCDTKNGIKKERCLSSSFDICVRRLSKCVCIPMYTQNTHILMQFEYVMCRRILIPICAHLYARSRMRTFLHIANKRTNEMEYMKWIRIAF